MGIWQSDTLNRFIIGCFNQISNVKVTSIWLDVVSEESVFISTLVPMTLPFFRVAIT